MTSEKEDWIEHASIHTSLADAVAGFGPGAVARVGARRRATRFDAPGSGESDGTLADDYRLSAYIDSVGMRMKIMAMADLIVGP